MSSPQEQPSVPAQSPLFRSMSMMKQTQPELAFGRGGEQKNFSHDDDNDMLFDAEAEYKTEYNTEVEYKTITTTENGQHLSSSSSPPPSSWTQPQLTPLGLYYPLGPCQTRLPKHQLSEILQRLTATFCRLSLHVQEYQNSPISATCHAMDNVGLEVSLFEARDNSEQVIVEIARRHGDSYLFHQYARQIMAEVTNEQNQHHQQHSQTTNATTPWNVPTLHLADSVTAQPTPQSDVEEALDSVAQMLQTDRFDARKLALEALVHMTDPQKSGWNTAQAFCHALLRPQPGSLPEQTSRRVLAYANMTASADSNMFFSEDEAYLGLRIVSQILQMAAHCQITPSFFLNDNDDLVASLMTHVSHVQTQPHHAYFAVTSLNALCECVPALRTGLAGAMVQQAHSVGETSHSALRRVSEKLLVTLQA